MSAKTVLICLALVFAIAITVVIQNNDVSEMLRRKGDGKPVQQSKKGSKNQQMKHKQFMNGGFMEQYLQWEMMKQMTQGQQVNSQQVTNQANSECGQVQKQLLQIQWQERFYQENPRNQFQQERDQMEVDVARRVHSQWFDLVREMFPPLAELPVHQNQNAFGSINIANTQFGNMIPAHIKAPLNQAHQNLQAKLEKASLSCDKNICQNTRQQCVLQEKANCCQEFFGLFSIDQCLANQRRVAQMEGEFLRSQGNICDVEYMDCLTANCRFTPVKALQQLQDVNAAEKLAQNANTAEKNATNENNAPSDTQSGDVQATQNGGVQATDNGGVQAQGNSNAQSNQPKV